MSTRPVAAMNESVARMIYAEHRGDPASIAVELAEVISRDGRWSANVCKPLIRAYEMARDPRPVQLDTEQGG